MTSVLLISDTHSLVDEWIIGHAREVDEVWHAGDIGSSEVEQQLAAVARLRAVYGNIDGTDLRLGLKEYLSFEVDGLTVLMTHIGGYPAHYHAPALRQISQLKPRLFVCGHSHILRVMFDHKRNMLCLNPGAVGRHGFHSVRTMLRFDIHHGEVLNMQVIEKPR